MSGAVADPVRARPSPREAWTARLLAPSLAGLSLLAGLAAGELIVTGHPMGILGFAVVILPVVVWRRPQTGPVILMVIATTIEQSPYKVGPRNGAATDRIPLFNGITKGLHVNPVDLLLLGLLLVWLFKTTAKGEVQWPRSALSLSVLGLTGAVVFGVFIGMAHHGDLRTSFTEVRPYIYLAMTYLLASVLLRTQQAIRSVLWALVLGVAFKSTQGIVIFFSVRSLRPRPDAVLGHEEALFFGVFIFLTLSLWLFEIRGSLRTTATVLFPIVLVADLVNGRRTAWLVLGSGLITLFIVGFVCLPERRRFLRRLGAATLVISAVYLPAYWNHTGTLAQPARGIRSVSSPDPRDASSNLYRVQENANLKLNIKQSFPFGKGFGVPINYALPIVDIKSLDPLITYIPHDGVLYIVMRMGVLGGTAFWSMLGMGIISACRLAKSANRELAALGALVVCLLVVYVFQGYNDQGFYFYRIAIAVGSMLGMSEAARRLDLAGVGLGLGRGRGALPASDEVVGA